jgi:hypothetical protein
MRKFTMGLTAVLLAQYAWAGSIFKCVDGNGGVSYQQIPCTQGGQQSEVVIRNDLSTPAPASPNNPRNAQIIEKSNGDAISNYQASAPAQAVSHVPPPVSNGFSTSPRDTSYECRLPNGEVFYRHDSCPSTASTGSSTTHDSIRGTWSTSSNDVSVTSRPVSREEACRKMNSAGAIGRDGRARDQQVSTYDKNLGRDPCR